MRLLVVLIRVILYIGIIVLSVQAGIMAAIYLSGTNTSAEYFEKTLVVSAFAMMLFVLNVAIASINKNIINKDER